VQNIRQMRYIDMHGHGGPEVMYVANGPVPEPRSGELLIKVAAAGVNGPDIFQRKGLYPPPPDASPVLGLELSGTVVAKGSDTQRYRVGDRVCALAPGGAYAEYAVVPEQHALPIPAGVSLLEAAGLPETYFTVWANVFEKGALKAGESVLIHGGAGGIGISTVQLAAARGATVYTTAAGAARKDPLSRLGASKVIDYKEQDFVAEVKKLTNNVGVNMVVDVVGADYLSKNLDVAAPDGRIIQIAWLSGANVSANMFALITKRLTWTGSTLRARSMEDKARLARALEAEVWPLFKSGALKPVVHAVIDLNEVSQAHEQMEQRHFGKIILSVDHHQLGNADE
jgi:NADPH:quinone reductase